MHLLGAADWQKITENKLQLMYAVFKEHAAQSKYTNSANNSEIPLQQHMCRGRWCHGIWNECCPESSMHHPLSPQRRWMFLMCEFNISFLLPVHFTPYHQSWKSSSQFFLLLSFFSFSFFLTHTPSCCFPVLLFFCQPIFYSLSPCFLILHTHYGYLSLRKKKHNCQWQERKIKM